MRITRILTALALTTAAVPGAGPDSHSVIWQAPGKVTLNDWIWGPGGKARAPKPPFEFVEEDLKGTNPKIKVRDAKGDHWIVKFGGENHSDVFASRLLYALGYVTQPSYFAASGVIVGAHNLRRAKPFLGKDGAFTYARFKLRDHKMLAHVEGQTWSWNDNPFVGTEELNGLKILMMLTSNWDAKDARDGTGSNTSVYSKPGSAENQLYYAFDDWGAAMGKWGGFFERDKWNPAGFREQTKTFARITPRQTIEWGYRGKHGEDVTSGIGAGDIRWLLTYLSRVTDEELRAGLRASGATQSDVEIYTLSMRDRITQLERLSAAPSATGITGTARSRFANPLFPTGAADLWMQNR
ncbi:MAG TPA: hypothetical protein VGZ73_07850 [Bryobacteraceae bacterium]|nr:hypothetical protein [Bryobacteraceae bacterium]